MKNMQNKENTMKMLSEREILYTKSKPQDSSRLICITYELHRRRVLLSTQKLWTYKLLDAYKLINYWNITGNDLKYVIVKEHLDA